LLKKTTIQEYQRQVLRVQHHLEQHLSSAIEPAQLAKIAGQSVHHFHRVFRAQSGESVMEFTRRMRLERAARLLRNSDHSVTQIAFEVGYQAHEAFTRAFGVHFGVSPREYRIQPVERIQNSLQITTEPRLPVCIVQEPEHHVLYMRHTGSYQHISQLWQRLVSWLTEHPMPLKIAENQQPRMFGVVPDDPDVTPEEKLRYDACFELDDGQPEGQPDRQPWLTGPVAKRVIPAGRYAVVVHQGPYETLSESYLDLIGRWFPKHGYSLAPTPVVEHYLNSPQDTPQDKLLTEVRVMMAPRLFGITLCQQRVPTC
jgi:AraC family transcriptional regulator